MTLRAVLYRWDELPLEKVTEMVARKAISGVETTLAQAYFKKGALVPLHAHPAEVFIYVLQGAIRMHVSGQDVTAREGDVLVLPPDAAHQAETLDDTFVLTVTPRREEGAGGVRS